MNSHFSTSEGSKGWLHLAFSALGKPNFGLGSPKASQQFLVQMFYQLHQFSEIILHGLYKPFWQHIRCHPLSKREMKSEGREPGRDMREEKIISKANTSNLDLMEDISSNKSMGLDPGCHPRIQTRLKHEGLPRWESIPRTAKQKCPKEQVNLWSGKLCLTHILFGSSDDSRD